MLHQLAFRGELSEIKKLFEGECATDVNERDKSLRTPLHWACSGKAGGVAKYLVEEKYADVNLVDDAGWSPLLIASSCGSDQIIALLLERGAQINCQNDVGCTSLHYSGSKNHAFLTKLLIKSGANVNIKENCMQETPLHRATSKGNYAVMELLLESGAHVDVANKSRETPLVLAINNNDLPAVELLLRFGASAFNIVNNKSPLDFATPEFKRKIKHLL